MKPGNLIEHPEGGRYQEVYRSKSMVTNFQGDNRSALTHIYFSLSPGEISGFHKVESDEIWNLYEGGDLKLYLWNNEQKSVETTVLSQSERNYCHVVPAGTWQAAEPMNEPVLVGCSVGPGFEFEGFVMMKNGEPEADKLMDYFPDLAKFIKG